MIEMACHYTQVSNVRLNVTYDEEILVINIFHFKSNTTSSNTGELSDYWQIIG